MCGRGFSGSFHAVFCRLKRCRCYAGQNLILAVNALNKRINVHWPQFVNLSRAKARWRLQQGLENVRAFRASHLLQAIYTIAPWAFGCARATGHHLSVEHLFENRPAMLDLRQGPTWGARARTPLHTFLLWFWSQLAQPLQNLG